MTADEPLYAKADRSSLAVSYRGPVRNPAPLAIDLFCGLGGWTEALLAEGWDVIGFDNHRHVYGDARYPAQLVLQDVLTLHGSQFRNADLIVASPPCQEFSYMAMPWKRGKQIARALRGEYGEHDGIQVPFPDPYHGSRTIAELTALFDACFRIQEEAIQATGTVICERCDGRGYWCDDCNNYGFTDCRHIPLIVENVRGAQPWVGRSAWNYGSFHLWGDVPALMPNTSSGKLPFHHDTYKLDGKPCNKLTDPAYGSSGVKRPGMNWSDRLNPDRMFNDPLKQPVWFNDDKRRGVKNGGDWFGSGSDMSLMRSMSSKSSARKAASAAIAKIPFPLAQHIARTFKPDSAALRPWEGQE